MTPDQLTILETALAAVAAGLSVHPPVQDGTKAPLGWYPDGFDESGRPRKTWLHPPGNPADEAQVLAWYGPRQGIGLRCGAEGAGLEVTEFDDPPTYAAFREAATACGLGDLLERVEAGYLESTPGGGVHLPYFCAEVRGNTKLARAPREPTEEDPRRTMTLIETRGENGYIIIAPSGGSVHKSGRPYVLLRGGLGTIATIASEERDELWALARLFDRMPRPAPADPRPRGRPPADGKLRPGDDFNLRATWEEILGDAGWTAVYRRGEETCWRRPGKDRGISATTNYRGNGFLYVFSASTEFEAERTYSKFGAYTHLKHSGNFEEAGRTLRRDGYGSPPEAHTDRQARPIPIGGTPLGGNAVTIEAVSPEVDGEVVDLWPRIDPWAFHGIAGEIVRGANPHTEADPIAVLAQFLTGFANLLGRGPHWHAGATKHYLSLFTALVGPTAAGRKGSSWDVAKYFLSAVDEDWSTKRCEEGVSSGEALIKLVCDKVTREEKGSTVIVEPGIEDKRLFLIVEELARIFKIMGREGATLSTILRQAWDTREVMSNTTKNLSLRASKPLISLVGHITPDELMSLLTKTDATNGLGNRFTWLLVRRSKRLPEGGAFWEQSWGSLIERLRGVRDYAAGIGLMRRDDEARAAWAQLYDRLTAAKPGLLGSMLARGEAQVMRLACVYALLDRSPLVRPQHLRAAAALWEYSEASARFIFGGALANPKAEKLLAALRVAPAGLTRTQILAQVFAGHLKAADLAALLQELFTFGMIHRIGETTAHTGPGRSAEVWAFGRDYEATRVDLTPPVDPFEAARLPISLAV